MLKLPADKHGSLAQFVDVVDTIAELVVIGAVGQIAAIPAVVVVLALENDFPASVFHYQRFLFAVFETIDDKFVVYPISVGGENIGDFNRDRT